MDRVSQLRGQGSINRSSFSDTSQSSNDLNESLDSTKYFTCDEGSTLSISASNVGLPDSDLSDNISEFPNNLDVTLTQTPTLNNESVFYETPGIDTSLSPIASKRSSIDCFKLGNQIDAANILSGNVDIFDDNENSYDENNLVIDDNAPTHDDKVGGDNESEIKNKDLEVSEQDISEIKAINPVNFGSQPLDTACECVPQQTISSSERSNMYDLVTPTNNEDITMIKKISNLKSVPRSKFTTSNPKEIRGEEERSILSGSVQSDLDNQIVYENCAARLSDTIEKPESDDANSKLEKVSLEDPTNKVHPNVAECFFPVPSTIVPTLEHNSEINQSAKVSSELNKLKDTESMNLTHMHNTLSMAQKKSINTLAVNPPTENFNVENFNADNSTLPKPTISIIPSVDLLNDLVGPINNSSLVNVNTLKKNTGSSNKVMASSKSTSELPSLSTDKNLAVNVKCNEGKTHNLQSEVFSNLDDIPSTENPVKKISNLIPTMSVVTENLPSISSLRNNTGNSIPAENVVADSLSSSKTSNLYKTMANLTSTNSINQTDVKCLQSDYVNPEEQSENMASLEVISENLQSSVNQELEENIMEIEEESPAQSANEVVLQIDGKPVDAIDIGNGLYLYRTDNDKLNAIQVLEDDGQPEFKFLKVRYNADGNLEVYEEIIETSGQEKGTIANRLNDESRTPSEVSIISANRRFFDQPSTSKSGLSLLDTQKGIDSKDAKINKSPSSTIKIKEKLNNNRTPGLVESRKSPLTYQTGTNKDTVPLTKSMVDQKLQGMSSDSSRKTIELSTTESFKKSNEIKEFESSKETQLLVSQDAPINVIKPENELNLFSVDKTNVEYNLIKKSECHEKKGWVENAIDQERGINLEKKIPDLIKEKMDDKIQGKMEENIVEKMKEKVEEKNEDMIKVKTKKKKDEKIEDTTEEKTENENEKKIEEKDEKMAEEKEEKIEVEKDDIMEEKIKTTTEEEKQDKIEMEREEVIDEKSEKTLDENINVKMDEKIEERIEEIEEKMVDKVERSVEKKLKNMEDKIKDNKIEQEIEAKPLEKIEGKNADKIEEKADGSKNETKDIIPNDPDSLKGIRKEGDEKNVITAKKCRDGKMYIDDIKPPKFENTKDIGTMITSCHAIMKVDTQNFSQFCEKMKKENVSQSTSSAMTIKPEFISSPLVNTIEFDEDSGFSLKNKIDETLASKSNKISENQTTGNESSMSIAQKTTALNLATNSSAHISTSPSVVDICDQPLILDKTYAFKNEKESIEHIAALAMTALSENNQNLQTNVHSPSLSHHALPQTNFRHKSEALALSTDTRAPSAETFPTVTKQESSLKQKLEQFESTNADTTEMNACKYFPGTHIESINQTMSTIVEPTHSVTIYSSKTPQSGLNRDLPKIVEYPKVEPKNIKEIYDTNLASNQNNCIKQDECQTSKPIQIPFLQELGSKTLKLENIQKNPTVGLSTQDDDAKTKILESNLRPNMLLEGFEKNIDPARQTESKPVPFGKWTEANKQAYLNKLKDSKTNISLQNSNVIKLPSPNNKNDLNSREFIKKTEIQRDAATVAGGSTTNSKLPLPTAKSHVKEQKTDLKIASVMKNKVLSESVNPGKQCYALESLVSPEAIMPSTNLVSIDKIRLASNSTLSESKPSTSKSVSASEIKMPTNFNVTKHTLAAAKDIMTTKTNVCLDRPKAPVLKCSFATESKMPPIGCAVKVSTPKPYVPPKQIQSDATQKQNDSKTKDFNYQSLIDKTIEDMINSQPKPMTHCPERSGNPTQTISQSPLPQNVSSNNHSNVGINPNYPNMQKATLISEDMYSIPGQYTVIPSETIISQKPYTAPNKLNEVIQKQYPGAYTHQRTYRNLSNTSQKISNVALLQDKQLLLPSKTSSCKQSLLEDMEKKMNELHGIPFVETPRKQNDSLSTNANNNENSKASVSTKTNKIPNLLPLPSKKIQQTTTTERDEDSDDEIFECEPVTGDTDNKWATCSYNQSLNLQQSSSGSPSKKTETVLLTKYKSHSVTKDETNKVAHRKPTPNQSTMKANVEKLETNSASVIEKKVSHPYKNITIPGNTKKDGDLQLIPVKPNNPVSAIDEKKFPNEMKYYSNMATDSHKYQSKVQMAYQTAITAKQLKEPPVTILEDKPVKVVYLENDIEISNQQQTVTIHSASLSKDIVEISATSHDCKNLKVSQDLKNDSVQLKSLHQRKQVFAPDPTVLDLIEPQELEELSPSPVRTEDIEKKNPKNIIAKKDYLLGRASLPKEDFKLAENVNESKDKLASKLDTMMPPKKDENKKDDEVSLSLPILRSNIRASIESSQRNIEIQKPKYKANSYKLKEKLNITTECSEHKEKKNSLKEQISSDVLVEKSECVLDTPKRKRGRPRKNPQAEVLAEKSTEKPNKTSHEKSSYKQSAKSPKKPKLSVSTVSEDSESNEDEEMIKENWTMGKINENIVCPICNKLFRSENVVFKHVKHCSGSSRSPTRSADSGDQDGIQKSAISINRSRSNSFDSQDLALLQGETSSNIPLDKSHQVSETIVIDDSPVVNESKVVKPKQEMLTPLSRLRKIMNVHGKAYNYTCELCGKNFRQLSYFNTHKAVHCKELNKKNTKSNISDALTCEICGKEFRQLHHLVQHRETQHNCNMSKLNRKSSIDQARIKSTRDENVAGFRCEPCDKSFRKLHHLVEHRETHDGVNKTKASQIMNIDSKQVSPQCEVCFKTFRKLHHLIEHREQHNETSNKELQFNTSKRPGLLAQDIIHECSLCYMVFPNEPSLARHYGICQRKKKQAKQKALQVLEEQKANDIAATKEQLIISCKTSISTEINKPQNELQNEPKENNEREEVNAAVAECDVKTNKIMEIADDQNKQNYNFTETILGGTDKLQTQTTLKGSPRTKIKQIIQEQNPVESNAAPRPRSKESVNSDNSDVLLKSKSKTNSIAAKRISKTSIEPEVAKGKQLLSSANRRSEDSTTSDNSDTPLKTISVEKSLDVKRLSKDSAVSDNSDAPLKPLQNLDSFKQRSSKRLSKEYGTEADMPSKSKKTYVKTMVTPKRKNIHLDKFATVTKRKRRTVSAKEDNDSLINQPERVDESEDEIRYMINPKFVASSDDEEKEIFMKIRTNKRNSLNLDKPKKVIRRKSLQDPIRVIQSRRKSSGKQIASSSKDLKPVTNNSFTAKEGKIYQLNLKSDVDRDDAEIKYSFPKKEVEVVKNITVPKNGINKKRKSLTGIAQKKSLGTLAKVSLCQNKVTANAKHASGFKRRTTMVEHRCDCGQLFSSSALLARHTTVAHTPPRLRRNRLTLVESKMSNSNINIKNETKTTKK